MSINESNQSQNKINEFQEETPKKARQDNASQDFDKISQIKIDACAQQFKTDSNQKISNNSNYSEAESDEESEEVNLAQNLLSKRQNTADISKLKEQTNLSTCLENQNNIQLNVFESSQQCKFQSKSEQIRSFQNKNDNFDNEQISLSENFSKNQTNFNSWASDNKKDELGSLDAINNANNFISSAMEEEAKCPINFQQNLSKPTASKNYSPSCQQPEEKNKRQWQVENDDWNESPSKNLTSQNFNICDNSQSNQNKKHSSKLSNNEFEEEDNKNISAENNTDVWGNSPKKIITEDPSNAWGNDSQKSIKNMSADKRDNSPSPVKLRKNSGNEWRSSSSQEKGNKMPDKGYDNSGSKTNSNHIEKKKSPILKKVKKNNAGEWNDFSSDGEKKINQNNEWDKSPSPKKLQPQNKSEKKDKNRSHDCSKSPSAKIKNKNRSNEYGESPSKEKKNKSRPNEWGESSPKEKKNRSDEWGESPPKEKKNRSNEWGESPPKEKKNKSRSNEWGKSPPKEKKNRSNEWGESSLKEKKNRSNEWGKSPPKEKKNRSNEWGESSLKEKKNRSSERGQSPPKEKKNRSNEWGESSLKEKKNRSNEWGKSPPKEKNDKNISNEWGESPPKEKKNRSSEWGESPSKEKNDSKASNEWGKSPSKEKNDNKRSNAWGESQNQSPNDTGWGRSSPHDRKRNQNYNNDYGSSRSNYKNSGQGRGSPKSPQNKYYSKQKDFNSKNYRDRNMNDWRSNNNRNTEEFGLNKQQHKRFDNYNNHEQRNKWESPHKKFDKNSDNGSSHKRFDNNNYNDEPTKKWDQSRKRVENNYQDYKKNQQDSNRHNDWKQRSFDNREKRDADNYSGGYRDNFSNSHSTSVNNKFAGNNKFTLKSTSEINDWGDSFQNNVNENNDDAWGNSENKFTDNKKSTGPSGNALEKETWNEWDDSGKKFENKTRDEWKEASPKTANNDDDNEWDNNNKTMNKKTSKNNAQDSFLDRENESSKKGSSNQHYSSSYGNDQWDVEDENYERDAGWSNKKANHGDNYRAEASNYRQQAGQRKEFFKNEKSSGTYKNLNTLGFYEKNNQNDYHTNQNTKNTSFNNDDDFFDRNHKEAGDDNWDTQIGKTNEENNEWNDKEQQQNSPGADEETGLQQEQNVEIRKFYCDGSMQSIELAVFNTHLLSEFNQNNIHKFIQNIENMQNILLNITKKKAQLPQQISSKKITPLMISDDILPNFSKYIEEAYPEDMKPFLKPYLILDLDETLINAVVLGPLEECQPGAEELVIEEDNIVTRLTLLVRPFTIDFLNVLNKSYNILIYSHGNKNYVQSIISLLDPDGSIIKKENCYFPCEEERQKGNKTLNKIKIKHILSSSIIVDDNLRIWQQDCSNNIMPSKKFIPFKKRMPLGKYNKFQIIGKIDDDLDIENLPLYEESSPAISKSSSQLMQLIKPLTEISEHFLELRCKHPYEPYKWDIKKILQDKQSNIFKDKKLKLNVQNEKLKQNCAVLIEFMSGTLEENEDVADYIIIENKSVLKLSLHYQKTIMINWIYDSYFSLQLLDQKAYSVLQ